MGQSIDPTYPLFPTFAFLGFVLSLLPLSWHIQAWNSGTCAFMLWTALSCLVGFVNSIVWSGSLDNPAPVWCDISSKIIIGVSVGIPASILCISRRLYYLTSGSVSSMTYKDKRRMVLVDVCIAAGIPVIIMILHYVVQGHRFDILEDIGCYPVIYNTLPAYFIYFMWPILLGVISFCYSAMTLRSFWIRRVQFSQVISSNTSMSVSRYLRLVMLAMIDMMCTTPLGVYTIYIGNVGVVLAPWVSWEDTHYNFSYVRKIPALIWRSDPAFRTSVELTRWLPVLCALLFFVLFGFASEARKSYQKAFHLVLKIFVVRPEKPVVKGLVTWNKKSSKASVVSTRSSIFPLPLYTAERVDSPNSVDKTFSISTATLTHAGTYVEVPCLAKQAFDGEKYGSCNCQRQLPLPLSTTTNRQKYDLESGGWGRFKRLDDDTKTLSIRQCTCTDTVAISSPTSSTHPTLIGQVIDTKRNDTAGERRSSGLPEIDESDAFTISSFSYYEGSVSPSTLLSTTSTMDFDSPEHRMAGLAPPTPPHPPSPRFLPPQHSLPPPPSRKQPRAVGSLSSLLSGNAETSRFSRESFSFHNPGHPRRHSNPFARSPLKYETWPPVFPVSPLENMTLDVPEDVGPASYTRPSGVLDGLPERDAFSPDYLPLTRKKSVLGIEGGVIQVVVERSASVDSERVV